MLQKITAPLPGAAATPTTTTDDDDDSAAREKRLQLAKDLKRAQFVADQAVQGGISLFDDPADADTVLHALVTLGEDARPIYLQLASINDDVDPIEVGKAFTTALAKPRLKNPSKFFKLAGDYGLNTRAPKSIAQAKQEADISQLIEDEGARKDYIEYGIFERDGVYRVLNATGTEKTISNFVMRILYHVKTTDKEAYRVVEIRNVFGGVSVMNMNTDDFVSVGGFKKIVAREGNYIWKGSEPDLCRLQDKLQREEKNTDLVTQLGWHRKGQFYAFANGIFDPADDKFYPVDKYGIVEHRIRLRNGDTEQRNFFIPALSKIFEDKDDQFTNDKKFVYRATEHSFASWGQQFVRVYGANGKIAMMFYVMAIFSDIIFDGLGKRFPILNVYGKPGTGKGELVGSIMKLFGDGQDQLMLGGASTVVGFMRKFSQFSNAIVWLDEYKNNLKINYIESLKNIYDRIGYERGKKDNTFQTESTPIRSACMLSGQEMPTIDPALFSRVILLMATENKYNDAQRAKFQKLKDWQKNGLSNITVELLKYRSVFAERWKEVFMQELRALITAVNNTEVPERILQNYAALVTTAVLMSGLEAMPFKPDEFRKLAKETLLSQFYVVKGSDDASRFFEVVEQLQTQGVISDGKHFKLADGYLYLRVQDIYPFYAEALQRRRDPNVLDKSTLEKYLESDTKIFIARTKKQIGGKYSWCFQFKYNELGIDLISIEDPIMRRRMQQEMGVENEPEPQHAF